jgi:hypothetical protein
MDQGIRIRQGIPSRDQHTPLSGETNCHDAVCEQVSALPEQNDVAAADFARFGSLDAKHITRPDCGKHTGA